MTKSFKTYLESKGVPFSGSKKRPIGHKSTDAESMAKAKKLAQKALKKRTQNESKLEEAFRIKANGRTLTVTDMSGGQLIVTVQNGALLIGGIKLPKKQAEAALDAIMTHFVKFGGELEDDSE